MKGKKDYGNSPLASHLDGITPPNKNERSPSQIRLEE